MVASGETPPYVTMLREQYRMAPAICDLVSEDYYLGQLSTAPERRLARCTPLPPPVESRAVILIDTSSLEPTTRGPDRANAMHARLIASLVHALKAPQSDGNNARVGVFTLYRGQVAALQRAAHGHRRADVVATVHRAQGGEVDVAILDLCDAPGMGLTFSGRLLAAMTARAW
jgi:superfamily I DNA and/or RNA helicase